MQQEQNQQDGGAQTQVKKQPVIWAPSDPGEENICIGCE
jgi:hypothetical protein